ncbi:glycosyl hydrolase family 79 C-terminal domain-containing protein [Comamonas endophytica]|uniref:Glycosyl hydrolase family 79 C-terminal domain-containing protein n=1 Tax=Comamonas endophytica TaxID=2949090 RepID=A0ABY6G5T8_9BURK|nr:MULTISPECIES: glycosyl hydrolase family 79 C-terminal domain-containing protein [unclassified Acidovorax]MCD2510972.1 glycosyl hydrolase family 79 C-terminal domain-containing protein [Acidovorax sp. D4N7]UYG50381.1 glycosyl hydrolase family 79 C-terminal domain-containing protein [Acidovorax sp. 5MLIR]
MPTTFPLHFPPLRSLAWTLAGAALLAGCQHAPKTYTHPALSAQPARIDAGQSARLSWDAPVGSSLRMSGLTATPPGAVLVHPAQTTTYTLSGPAPSGDPISASTTVEVRPAAQPLASLRIEGHPVGSPIAEGFLGLAQGAGAADGRNRQLLRNLENYGGGPLRAGAPGTGTCPAVDQLAHAEPPRSAVRCTAAADAAHGAASALWTAEMLLDYAQWGAAGVNLQGPLQDARDVGPGYYGMLFFAQFAGAQGRWLATQLETSVRLRAWAVRDERNQSVRVALIHRDPGESGTVDVQLPAGMRQAVVTRLTTAAPLRLAGQTFDGSRDGRPIGTAYGEILQADENGQVVLSLPASSAALLTLTP